MKKLLITLFLALAVTFAASADVLYLNEGEEIVGRLKEITDGKIAFEELNHGPREFKEAEVAHILISKVRKGDEIENVASITEPVASGILKTLPDPALFQNADYVTPKTVWKWPISLSIITLTAKPASSSMPIPTHPKAGFITLPTMQYLTNRFCLAPPNTPELKSSKWH